MVIRGRGGSFPATRDGNRMLKLSFEPLWLALFFVKTKTLAEASQRHRTYPDWPEGET